jgi:hypothetical protein
LRESIAYYRKPNPDEPEERQIALSCLFLRGAVKEYERLREPLKLSTPNSVSLPTQCSRLASIDVPIIYRSKVAARIVARELFTDLAAAL